MIKGIAVGDPHVMGANPKYRKDYYPDTILEKMIEVGEIATTEQADFVLIAGDLISRPDTAPSIIRKIGRILKDYPCPVYGVIGNHDEFGYNPETIDRSMLGVLDAAGLYNIIPEEGIIIDKDNLKVLITGQNSDYKIDRDGSCYGYISRKPEGIDKTVHLVHGFLANKKWHDKVHHTLIDDVVEKTEADLIIAGHEHSGFGIIERGNKIFSNPGALGRISAAVGEVNRTVNILSFEITKEDISARLIPITRAMPADEVLDREQLEKEKSQKANIEAFASNLRGFEIKTSNVYEIIDLLAELDDEVDKEIVKEAKSRIEASHLKTGGELG